MRIYRMRYRNMHMVYILLPFTPHDNCYYRWLWTRDAGGDIVISPNERVA